MCSPGIPAASSRPGAHDVMSCSDVELVTIKDGAAGMVPVAGERAGPAAGAALMAENIGWQ